ncbi:hypothetical protein ISG33_12945 [Glaciecola sp. MH2013]|uniref:hypothetical protein n=1 Tax=Glaciecola sp. MH2013 TaxID=2785524 RepID=UPI0018A0B0E9|nr:hypothetical protein [Glaciecola sp. MH2013]MBF7074307.1 hypothetical protein [Glaciecola sp. MH2013]
MACNGKQERTAQVSIRLGLSEHRDLKVAAENAGTTLSDIARERIRLSTKQIELSAQLSQLEKRLSQKVFDICCAVANLSEDEKRDAAKSVNRNRVQRGNGK